ncbi:MAG TPA: hypothetical protein VM938_14650 [Acidimicrobiales bacterium]|nr:hypothetical protein [Acidimicrobiales bacterium]
MVAADGRLSWGDVVVRLGPVEGAQSYEPATNVLRTRMPAAEVVDFLPWLGDSLRPDGRVMRVVSGPFDLDVEPVNPGARVVRFSAGVAFDDTVVRTVDAGEHTVVTVGPDDEGLSLDGAMDLLDRTERAWRSWLAPMSYDGAWRAVVERSLLAVKAQPVGGVGATARATRTYAALGLDEDADAGRSRLRALLAEAELPELLLAALDVARALDGDVAPEVVDCWADEWREAERPRQRLHIARALRLVAQAAFARNPLDLAAAAWRAEAIEIEREVVDDDEPGVVELADQHRWEDAHGQMDIMLGSLSSLGFATAPPPDVGSQLDVVDAAVALGVGPR